MWSDEESQDEPIGWKRRLGRMALGTVLVGGLGMAIYFMVAGMSKTQRHAIQTVTRVTLPPPPPPPRPPPPKPPEPEKVVETPKMQEPKIADKPPNKAPPKPQQPPASPLTAEAGTGANPYGLAVGDGSGNVVGGGGGATYLSYGRIVSTDVQAALRHEDALRFAKYTAELRIWLDAAGKVTRVQLASSSGDPAVDSAVTRSLTGLAMHEPPPRDMPQPIRLRTKSEPG